MNLFRYQLKILTTAVFSVLMLNKNLIKSQWFSLVVLVAGVAMVQLSDSKETSVVSADTKWLSPPSFFGSHNLTRKTLQSDLEQSKLMGFSAALSACVLSGLAGVYFEKILKGSAEVSVWMRNVQLSLLSLPLGFGMAFIKDGTDIASNGFFFG